MCTSVAQHLTCATPGLEQVLCMFNSSRALFNVEPGCLLYIVLTTRWAYYRHHESTTQHLEPMSIDQTSWVGLKPELSAHCLNAWVTYDHTPYCTTYVSTAVIYSDQLESRLYIATLDSRQEALLQVMRMNWHQNSQISPMMSLWNCQRKKTHQQPAWSHKSSNSRHLCASYCFTAVG